MFGPFTSMTSDRLLCQHLHVTSTGKEARPQVCSTKQVARVRSEQNCKRCIMTWAMALPKMLCREVAVSLKCHQNRQPS